MAGITVLPVIWGMFSKKITQSGVFIAIISSSLLIIPLKFGLLIPDGWFVSETPSNFMLWILNYVRTFEAVGGVIIPLIVLLIIEALTKSESKKYIPINQHEEDETTPESSLFPAKIMAISIGALGVIIMLLAVTASSDVAAQWILSLLLYLISGSIYLSVRKTEKKRRLTVKP